MTGMRAVGRPELPPVRTWWLARGERSTPDGDLWLTPAESERLTTLRFRKRRTEYLLRRWVGKQAVADRPRAWPADRARRPHRGAQPARRRTRGVASTGRRRPGTCR